METLPHHRQTYNFGTSPHLGKKTYSIFFLEPMIMTIRPLNNIYLVVHILSGYVPQGTYPESFVSLSIIC